MNVEWPIRQRGSERRGKGEDSQELEGKTLVIKEFLMIEEMVH